MPVVPVMMPLARQPFDEAGGDDLAAMAADEALGRPKAFGVSGTYRPQRLTKARPPLRPIGEPMLSPATAAAVAISTTPAMSSRPAPAYPDAAIRIASP